MPDAREAGIPFGRYLLLKRLARGGMAEVFLARQQGPEGFDRIVALKRILPHLVDSEDFVKMFLNEARLAARLTHPNVVHIYEFGKVDEHYFIAMEYVDGVHAGLLIEHAAVEPLPASLVARIGADACAALSYAHRAEDSDGRPLHLVHRDISPPNLMISYDGVVKLVDFGIAKAVSTVEKTRTGIVKGKFAYMSPEQTMGKKLDGRSDVFSLTLVLWELLAGTVALDREDPVETMKAIRDGQLPSIRSVRPDVPHALVELIELGLANRPDARPTAAELGHMFEGFIKSSPELGTAMQLSDWIRQRFARQPLESASDSATMAAAAASPHQPNPPPARAGTIPPVPGFGPGGMPAGRGTIPPGAMYAGGAQPMAGQMPANSGPGPGGDELGTSMDDDDEDDDEQTAVVSSDQEGVLATIAALQQQQQHAAMQQHGMMPHAGMQHGDMAHAGMQHGDMAHAGMQQHGMMPPPGMQQHGMMPHAGMQHGDMGYAGMQQHGGMAPHMSMHAMPMHTGSREAGATMPRMASSPLTGTRYIALRQRRIVLIAAVCVGVVLGIVLLFSGGDSKQAAVVVDAGAGQDSPTAARTLDAASGTGASTPDAAARQASAAIDAAVPPPDAASAKPASRLTVVTMPSGAEVIVGDREPVPSPATIPDLAPGSYTVRIELDGYEEVERSIEVRAGDNTVDIPLKAVPKSQSKRSTGRGKLSVVTKPWSEVYLDDGRKLGTTPFANVVLREGSYTLTFKSPKYRTTKRKVKISAGKTTKLSINLDRK